MFSRLRAARLPVTLIATILMLLIIAPAPLDDALLLSPARYYARRQDTYAHTRRHYAIPLRLPRQRSMLPLLRAIRCAHINTSR